MDWNDGLTRPVTLGDLGQRYRQYRLADPDALDEALSRLAAEDPVASRVVELRHFAGLSIEDAAATLGMSRATAYRHWTYARAWAAGCRLWGLTGFFCGRAETNGVLSRIDG